MADARGLSQRVSEPNMLVVTRVVNRVGPALAVLFCSSLADACGGG
ncbi:MAG: hypothetical protein AAGG46_09320 [Planctomycetota bacterium]